MTNGVIDGFSDSRLQLSTRWGGSGIRNGRIDIHRNKFDAPVHHCAHTPAGRMTDALNTPKFILHLQEPLLHARQVLEHSSEASGGL
jgi:hypothetical protein